MYRGMTVSMAMSPAKTLEVEQIIKIVKGEKT